MRVLLWMIDGSQIGGGHRTQIEQTARALRALGVEANISFEAQADLDSVDLVHGFGLSLAALRKCREKRLPIALSTIYWSRAYTTGAFAHRGIDKFFRRSKLGFSMLLSAVRGRYVEKCDALSRGWQENRVRFEMADLLLPNSRKEANQIVADLGVTTPMRVVPNAVDEVAFDTTMLTEGERRGVLCVGRFEPHKNQLGLINVLRGSGTSLTLIGSQHPHHSKYYEECRRRIDSNMQILEGIPHDALRDVYRKAKVHVLPSWFETTGLVSLEAALAGCNIVTTSRGYASEYFEDMAWYCDPARPDTIRSAIESALASSFHEALRSRICEKFTWKRTAEGTMKAYEGVLGDSRNRCTF